MRCGVAELHVRVCVCTRWALMFVHECVCAKAGRWQVCMRVCQGRQVARRLVVVAAGLQQAGRCAAHNSVVDGCGVCRTAVAAATHVPPAPARLHLLPITHPRGGAGATDQAVPIKAEGKGGLRAAGAMANDGWTRCESS